MNVAELPVFVFGLSPDPDEVYAFPTPGEARGFLNGYLFSESLIRVLGRGKSRPVIYTITGQPLTTKRVGLYRYPILVPNGAPDDADLQARLDAYATRRGLPVPVTDRVALANQLLRESWEQRQAAPPLPKWLARRMPDGDDEDRAPQI